MKMTLMSGGSMSRMSQSSQPSVKNLSVDEEEVRSAEIGSKPSVENN